MHTSMTMKLIILIDKFLTTICNKQGKIKNKVFISLHLGHILLYNLQWLFLFMCHTLPVNHDSLFIFNHLACVLRKYIKHWCSFRCIVWANQLFWYMFSYKHSLQVFKHLGILTKRHLFFQCSTTSYILNVFCYKLPKLKYKNPTA